MQFKGIVEEGDQIARHYGCPTANIWIDGSISCREGTYAGIVKYKNKEFESAIYCVNDGAKHRIEAHLFNFNGKLVGSEIEGELLQHVSDVVPFMGEKQMQKKIDNDLTAVRAYFATRVTEEDPVSGGISQLLGA